MKDLNAVLTAVAVGAMTPEAAEKALRDLPFQELGFAKLDHHRKLRTGCGEVVYGAGKTASQLLTIVQALASAGEGVLCTRCSAEQAALLTENGVDCRFDPVSRTLILPPEKPRPPQGGVAVCTGGTADLPVAEEAAKTAEFFGAKVSRYYDVGIAGIHRLFAHLEAIRRANAVVAVAGMEGALAGVLAGLVEVPVIAVPTSVGYGASFEGIAPLLTMLNSCAEGITVVNIDNGFGAGYSAAQINRLIEGRRNG